MRREEKRREEKGREETRREEKRREQNRREEKRSDEMRREETRRCVYFTHPSARDLTSTRMQSSDAIKSYVILSNFFTK